MDAKENYGPIPLRIPPERPPAISAEVDRKNRYDDMIYNILPAIPIWEFPNCKRPS